MMSYYIIIQDLGIATAERLGHKVIIANDPDADRFTLAEKQTGDVVITWRIFNGNEIGAILAWWAFENYRLNNPQFDGMLYG